MAEYANSVVEHRTSQDDSIASFGSDKGSTRGILKALFKKNNSSTLLKANKTSPTTSNGAVPLDVTDSYDITDIEAEADSNKEEIDEKQSPLPLDEVSTPPETEKRTKFFIEEYVPDSCSQTDPMTGYPEYCDNSDRQSNQSVDSEVFYYDKRNSLAKRPDVGPLHDSLSISLSGIYGIFLVVIGAVIPIAQTFSFGDQPFAFELFYIYLYSVSLCFLGYVYIYLLRRYRMTIPVPQVGSIRKHNSFSGLLRGWSTRSTSSTTGQPLRRRRRVSLDPSNHHAGSFYLRIGAIAFGIGSMIHSGLHMGQSMQMIDGPNHCLGATQLIKPLLHLAFTFSQLYFIFLNSKMCVNRFKSFGRFGMMHMCGTNICVWFRSIVVETLHAIQHSEHATHDTHDTHETSHADDRNGDDNIVLNISNHISDKLISIVPSGVNVTKKIVTVLLPELSCNWDDQMGSVVADAGPYLYPCTIEYSLICAGILYVVWTNVGKGGKKKRHQSAKEYEEQSEKRHKMSVDCANSSRGLFSGIFLTVGAIISMIGFYVLIARKELVETAILLVHVSETAMYLVTTIALIFAAIRMRNLRFQINQKAGLEETLILISFTGLETFALFSIIAALFGSESRYGALTIFTNLTMIIQSTLQTILMLAGDRLSAINTTQEKKKPGREFVTFLLLCNFAMWMMNTFETQKQEHNPIQLEFYGPVAWSILTHISVPLGIFYRFHSSVCLSNIWKNAWKLKRGHF